MYIYFYLYININIHININNKYLYLCVCVIVLTSSQWNPNMFYPSTPVFHGMISMDFSQRLAQRPSCTHWFTRLTRRQQLGKSPKMAIEMAIQEATDFRRPSRLILGNYPGIFLEKNEGFEQLHVELIYLQALERFGKIRTGTCCLPMLFTKLCSFWQCLSCPESTLVLE